MTPGIFVTGGGGFVGERVLQVLLASGRPVTALDRTGRIAAGRPGGERITVVAGDLTRPDTYRKSLHGCDTVVHLAAATGKAPASEHHRVNAAATATLIDECRRAGVRNFLFVSSIAAAFASVRGYPYGQSKVQAEQTVRESTLRFAILRPTMILGPNAPILGPLEKLATLPVVVVPGTGRIRVQPIHVDDVARAIETVIREDLFTNSVFEIGGADVVAIEDLLVRLRRNRRGTDGRVVRVPLGLVQPALRVAEACGLLRVLPTTAGQLTSFRYDGVAAANPLQERISAGLSGLDRMLVTEATVDGGAAVLDAECAALTRYVIGREANAYVQARYAEAHVILPALTSADRFDNFLVSVARRGAPFARMADVYAAQFARESLLRKKLVLLLAVLETSPPFFHDIDRSSGSRTAVIVGGAVAGVVSLAALVAGLLFLLPARVLLSSRRRQSA